MLAARVFHQGMVWVSTGTGGAKHLPWGLVMSMSSICSNLLISAVANDLVLVRLDSVSRCAAGPTPGPTTSPVTAAAAAATTALRSAGS